MKANKRSSELLWKEMARLLLPAKGPVLKTASKDKWNLTDKAGDKV